ncbi:MAG: hypothetical protein JNM70_17570 [Anaerolineae bacterium]|nr:hypothetical protein [Anaerolineae bacterium]
MNSADEIPQESIMFPMNEYIVALIALSFMLLMVGTVFSLSVIRKLRSEETGNPAQHGLFRMGTQAVPIRTIAVPPRIHHGLGRPLSQSEQR